MAHFLGQLYNREVTEEDDGHGDPLLGDQAEQQQPLSRRRVSCAVRLRIGTPKSSGSRSFAPHSSQSTANVDENGAAARRAAVQHLAAAARALGSGSRPRTPRTSAARAPQRRQIAVQSPSTFRRSSRSQSEALPTVLTIAAAVTVALRHGDRTRGGAERLAPAGQGVGPRPRGPARHLPQHAPHARRRGARAHPLPPGEDPRLVLHRPRQRGRRRSASRPRWAPEDVGTPLHRDMGVHITRGVEPWRIFANYMGRVDGPARRAATGTCTWPTRASG